MPMQRGLYPADWREVAARRKKAARWRCQECGAMHGAMTVNRHGMPCKVVVTVAHLDHDVWNRRARLRVLCARCHIRYDARQRRRKQVMMAMARGQLPLWKEVRGPVYMDGGGG
jgi:hypothetical protein